MGHRVNCAAFTKVAGLVGRTVVQVACGAQHNLARVVVSGSGSGNSGSGSGRSSGGGSSSGSGGSSGAARCEVFVWDNGALGQLGLGRKVTGRRVPAPLALPPRDSREEETRDVVFVAAGQNHSVCVVRGGGGGLYSWGHGECVTPPSPKSYVGDVFGALASVSVYFNLGAACVVKVRPAWRCGAARRSGCRRLHYHSGLGRLLLLLLPAPPPHGPGRRRRRRRRPPEISRRRWRE
jgi:hypothetical protein